MLPIDELLLNKELDTLGGVVSKKVEPGNGDELNRAPPIGLEFRFEPAEGIYIGEEV